jgi:hypothetical protein
MMTGAVGVTGPTSQSRRSVGPLVFCAAYAFFTHLRDHRSVVLLTLDPS